MSKKYCKNNNGKTQVHSGTWVFLFGDFKVFSSIKERKQISMWIKTLTLTEIWIEDKILHPKFGFGVVEDTIAYEYISQKIYVHFDDDTYHVFDSKEVCKIIHGIAHPYSKKMILEITLLKKYI